MMPRLTEAQIEAQIEEMERLLSYWELHGAINGWSDDAVTLLRAMLPDWSAFKTAPTAGVQ